MSEIECPYCGADCGVPDEHTNEGELIERDCESCEKSFVYSCQYSVDYDSQKADCLNGGEHKWEKIVGAPAEFFKDKYRCKFCDLRETIDEDSFIKRNSKLEEHRRKNLLTCSENCWCWEEEAKINKKESEK